MKFKFKVGDRARVRKDLNEGRNFIINVDKEMTKFAGKIVTISKSWESYDGNPRYQIKEISHWNWTDDMFENEEYTYEDLKKSPIGTKITFENRAVLLKLDGGYYRENRQVGMFRSSYDLINLKDNFGNSGKIIKIEEPEYTTVYERKEEILNEAEKRYLRNFIRPFRDKVKAIRKTDNNMNEYITVTYKNGLNTDFPNFKPNTMYKGMELYKEYTLKELGL